MTKPKQLDLEEAIAAKPIQAELADAFTGELFQPRSRNHYEFPDPVPKAPRVAQARPTVRQRIENLLHRGIDPLQDYVRRSNEADDLNFDVPDDPEAPLTPSEANYVDMVASELAEAAPLPDDGLPRETAPKAPIPPDPKAADAPGGGSPAANPAPQG